MKCAATCTTLLLATSTACTPTQRFGNEARYAPDYRAYVAVQPPDTRARFLFWNPITRKKIRCLEELEPFLGPITQDVASQVHDDNRMAATLPVTVGLLYPVSGGGTAFLLSGIALRGPSDGLGWLMSSPSAGTFYDRGKRALDAGRFADSQRFFELALAKHSGDVEVRRASYFLGTLYEKEGRPRDASRAFREFVERAAIRDQKAYDEAEKHLAALDATPPPCRSQAPVTFTWPRPR